MFGVISGLLVQRLPSAPVFRSRSPLKCSFALDGDDDDDLDATVLEVFTTKQLKQGPTYVPISLIEAR